MFDFEPVSKIVNDSIGNRLFPGAAISVCHKAKPLLRHYAGRKTYVPWSGKVDRFAFFDLASLTKPLVTVLSIMVLVDKKQLCLDDRLISFFDNVPRDKHAITVQQLLSHASGLPAHEPFYHTKYMPHFNQDARRIEAACRLIFSLPLAYEPGSRAVYSDLGYMILGRIVEKITGSHLFDFASRQIFIPCGLEGLSWQKGPNHIAQGAVPTGFCHLRKRILMGEVHDQNAWLLGGAAGHAGLFGTLEAVERLLLLLTRAYREGDEIFPVSRRTLRSFINTRGIPAGSTWCLGFDSPSPTDSSAGRFFSPNSIGHLGYTGGSFWIDLDQDLMVILLSNRTFPFDSSDSKGKIRLFRQRLHDTIRTCMGLDA